MDPLNNNPTPTPNPTPNPVPEPVIPPEPVVSPVSEPIAPTAPVIPPEPVVPPVTPEPVSAPEPVSTPEPISAPEPITTPEPVNPVINPTGATPSAAFQPEVSGIAATDPIMTAEPPKAPDPVEEELKAPMVAAGPVPGSIGSAISGGPVGDAANGPVPTGDNPFNNNPADRAQSVAFNDPAMEPTVGTGGGKKPNKFMQMFQEKKTMFILIAVAAVVVVVLLIILIIQLVGGSSTPAANSDIQNPNDNPASNNIRVYRDTLSCTRNMVNTELAPFNDAIAGTLSITAEFENEELSQISLVKSIVFRDEDAVSNEPVESEVHEAVADELTKEGAAIYYLPVEDDEIVMYLDEIETNYESLDFTCELL